MKKNLFRKFLALFLTGTMLAGVGCKDYDDDIDNINNRIDEIETVKLPGIQTQIESVKASIPDLTDLNKRVGTLEGDTKTLKDDCGKLQDAVNGLKDDVAGLLPLKTQVANLQKQVDGMDLDKVKGDLEQQIKDLQGYVDKSIKEATSEETLSKLFATVESVKKLSSDLEGFETTQKALEDALKKLNGDVTVDGSVKKTIADAIEALNISSIQTQMNSIQEMIDKTLGNAEWLGKEIDKYVKALNYVDAAGAADAALAEIQKANEDANSEYYKAIEALVKKIGVEGYVKTSEFEDAKTKYDAAIKALETRVLELEGRIQSLVYVPTSLAEVTTNTITINGSPFITMQDKDGKSHNIFLGVENSGNESVIEATFMVSPASLAAKMTEETVSLVTEEITTRAAAPAFTIVEVKNQDVATGKFTVVAKTDYQYGSSKTLAVALNVKIASNGQVATSDTENTPAQGIDYTTAFIGTQYEAGKAINKNLVVCRLNPDKTTEDVMDNDTFPELGGDGLKYNDYETVVEFFKDVKVYYTDADGMPCELSEAWKNNGWGEAPVSTMIVPEKGKVATVDPETNKANYKLTERTAQILKDKGVPAMIDDQITSEAFSFDIVLGDYTYRVVKNAKSQFEIIKDNTNVIADKSQTVSWAYAMASGSGDYAAADYLLNPDPSKPQITHDVYNALVGKDYSDLYIFKGDVDVTGDQPFEVAEITFPSKPTDDRTEQHLNLVLAGSSTMASGTYTIKAVYDYQGTDVTIQLPVVIEGMPEIKLAPVTAEIAYKAGVNTYDVIETYAEALWKEAWAPKIFADKKTFVDAVKAAAFEATAGEAKDKTALSVSGDNIAIVLGAGANEKSYTLTGAITADWGLNVTITVTANFTGIGGRLVQGDNYTDPVLLTAKLTDLAYVPDALNLDNTWVAPKDSEGKEIGKVAFSVDAEQYKGASVADKMLTWGSEYKGLNMTLKAILTLDSYELDEQPLNVQIPDPIKDKAITLKKDAVTTIEATTTDADLTVGDQLVLNNINSHNVFAAEAANENTALGVKITYEVANPEVLVDRITKAADFATSGKLTVKGNPDSDFTGEKTVKVNVTVVYDYGKRENFVANIVVKQKKEAIK